MANKQISQNAVLLFLLFMWVHMLPGAVLHVSVGKNSPHSVLHPPSTADRQVHKLTGADGDDDVCVQSGMDVVRRRGWI